MPPEQVTEQVTQPTSEAPKDAAGRDKPTDSIDAAVARLLRKPEEAKPKVEPEQAQLEETEEEGEELETEETSEYEGEDDESEDSDQPTEDEEESESEEGDDEGELYFTVKIDGEDYEVSADELRSGYQRQKDYTKKTQQLAEQRKEYDAKVAELTGQFEQIMQNASLANDVLNRDMKKFEQVDWEALKVKDPVGYVQKQIELQDIRNQQAQLRQQAQSAFEANQKVQQENLQKALESERKRALEAFPEWKNPDKAAVHQSKIADYARSIGYTDDELRFVQKAKDLLVLDKARKYDELQKTKKGITTKAKPTVRKLVKSKGTPPKGAAKRKAVAESRGRLQQSGSLKDAAALMYEMRRSKVIQKPR